MVCPAQRVEDPLRVSLVSVGNSTVPIVLKCYGPLLFDPILTGADHVLLPPVRGSTSRSGPCFSF